MLKWMKTDTLRGRIRNEYIRHVLERDERELLKLVWICSKRGISEPVKKIESWISGDLKRE